MATSNKGTPVAAAGSGLRRFGAASLLVLVATVSGASPALADLGSSNRGDRVVVKFAESAGPSARLAVRRSLAAGFLRTLPLPGVQVLSVPGGSASDVASALAARPGVEWAEPDFRLSFSGTPSDSEFGQQWGLSNTGQVVEGIAGAPDSDIDAPEAWEVVRGDDDVLVAVVDSGVTFDHPDLAPNLFLNAGESGGRESNGVDDDGNGFIDDFRGWDFQSFDRDPSDEIGHGTHVAGALGARGDNGIGGSGVAQRVRMLPVKIGGPDGPSASAAAAGLRYAAAMGARLVNASFSGPDFSRVMLEAIRSAPNTLFVTAAGNDSKNVDSNGEYPCAYDEANVICVTASDQTDGLTSFANIGAGSVDIAAPGRAIYSTFSGGGYRHLDGTSMAASLVSGVGALVMAQYPAAGTAYLRRAILGSAELRPSLRSRVATGGRVNALLALDTQGPRPFSLRAPGDGTGTRRTKPSFTWRATMDEKSGLEGYELVVDGRVVRRVSSRITTTRPSTALSEGRHTWLVRAFDQIGQRRSSKQARTIIVDRTPPELTAEAAAVQRPGAALTGGIAVSCGSNEEGRCTIELRVGSVTARRLGLPVRGNRSVGIGRRSIRIREPGTQQLLVRLTRAARRGLSRRLRGASGATFKIRARIETVDVAGNRRALERAIEVRRDRKAEPPPAPPPAP